MFYKEDVIPRIADFGRDGKLSLNAMFGIMENLGANHCTYVKDDVMENALQGISWVCTNWRVRILKKPAAGLLEGATWARKKENGATVLRSFSLSAKGGKELIIAEAKFVRMNFLKGKLLEITDELYQRYEPEEKDLFEDSMTKLVPPEAFEAETPVMLRASDIDFNGHVHNTRYIDIAAAGIPAGGVRLHQAKEISIAFRKAVKETDTVTVKYATTPTGCFISVCTEQGDCCYLQITGE